MAKTEKRLNDTSEPRRQIDLHRERAGSMQVKTPDDDSHITEMITTSDRLLIVKQKGVYETKLADQIDPGRTNISVPNTIQRLLPQGSATPWIGATVLTANALFKKTAMMKAVNGDDAFGLVLKMAEDISSAYALRDSYATAERDAVATVGQSTQRDQSFIVPSVGGVEQRCNEFLQRVDHALQRLFRLVQLFYSDIDSGGWNALKAKIDAGPQNVDNFSEHLGSALLFFKMVRNARNCVEHPRPEQRLLVTNFSLDATNALLLPAIQVVHPKTPLVRTSVVDFFSQILDGLVFQIEMMMVFLCARHLYPIAGFPVYIMEIPPESRKSHVKFGYGTLMGDQLVPIG